MSFIKNDLIFLEKDSKSPQQSEQSRNNSKADNNTLGALTKKFVQLIKNSPNQTIEIQQASLKLGIQKRRIYDITNVLQGIGYIQKIAKNSMKWVGGVEGCELEKELQELEQKRIALQLDSRKLKAEIEYLNQVMNKEAAANCELNYLLSEDITSIMQANNLKHFLFYTGAGGTGDRMDNDYNPQTKQQLLILQPVKKQGKLYLCYKDKGPSILHSQFQLDQQNHRQVQRLKKIAEKSQKLAPKQWSEEKDVYEKEQLSNYNKRKIKFSPADIIINGSIYDLDDSPLFQQDLFRVSQ